jgi:hypothetical protein
MTLGQAVKPGHKQLAEINLFIRINDALSLFGATTRLKIVFSIFLPCRGNDQDFSNMALTGDGEPKWIIGGRKASPTGRRPSR